MAIVSEVMATKMLMQLNCGMVDGKEVIKNKTYSNVRADASPQNLLAVGTAIGSLIVPGVEAVEKVQTALIYDDGM